jgi:hypothetical protein
MERLEAEKLKKQQETEQLKFDLEQKRQQNEIERTKQVLISLILPHFH